MKSTSYVFDLIKIMSKGEKRYFRLQNTKYNYKDKPNFIKLFEYFDTHNLFNEKDLKIVFKGQSWIKNLAFEKHRLYHLLLNALVMYEDSNAPGLNKENLLIRKVEVLFNKKLFDQCSKLLKKTKEITINKEYFLSSLRLSEIEEKLARYIYTNEAIFNQMPKIHEERKSLIGQYMVLNRCSEFFNEIKVYYGKRGAYYSNEDKEAIKNKMNPIINELEQSLNSNVSKATFHRAMTLYYSMLDENETGYNHQCELIKFMNVRYQHKSVDVSHYQLHLYNKLVYEISLHKFVDFKTTLEQFKQLKEETTSERGIIKHFLYGKSIMWEVKWLTKDLNGIYEEAEEYTSKITFPLGKYDLIVELNSYWKLAYIYFVFGEFDKAEEFSRQILESFDRGMHLEYHASFRLLNLVCHYELGSLKLLAPLAKSAYRFLKRQNELTERDKEILNFMKTKVFISYDRKKFIRRAIVVRDRLATLRASTESAPRQIFDMVSWLTSKIEDRSFSDLVVENEPPISV